MGFSQAPGLPYSRLGIAEDGDAASRAISKGKYVIWKGKNYFAKTDILQGETFVEDMNLTEIPDGAINGIADALNASLLNVELGQGQDVLQEANATFTVPQTGIISAYVRANGANQLFAVISNIRGELLYTTVSIDAGYVANHFMVFKGEILTCTLKQSYRAFSCKYYPLNF